MQPQGEHSFQIIRPSAWTKQFNRRLLKPGWYEMNFGHYPTFVAALFALFLSACAPLPPVTDPARAQTPLTQATATPIGEEDTLMQNNGAPLTPDAIIARSDLAQRLQVDEESIEIVRVEELEWPDGSLGCPQPEMLYTQALVNGVFIQLSFDGQSYNYHGGGGRQPFLCTSKNELLPDALPPELRGDPDI